MGDYVHSPGSNFILVVYCVNLHGWFRVEEALFIIKEEYKVDLG